MRRNPIGSLSTRKIVLFLSLTAIFAALFQIALGTSLSILALALCSISAGLLGFALLGAYNLAAWGCLIYALGSVVIAFYAKTVLGQPLDSNLYTPFVSFLVEAICCFTILCALILATWINVGKPILQPIMNLGLLRLLSWTCFAIGLAIHLFHRYGDQQAGGPEYGGLTLFGSLMYMGIIARTAYAFLRSAGRRNFDVVLVLMLIVLTADGLLGNGKADTALPWICFFATILFFKGGLPWRYIAGMVCGVLLFVAAVAPLIHVFRGMGLRNLTLANEIEAFENTLPLILNPEQFAFQTGRYERAKGYYNYFGGGKGQMLLGRYSSIQEIDPVIAAVDASEPMGSDVIISAVRGQLPKFIDPDKPKITNDLLILQREGLTNGSHGGFPTLPFAGEIYAAFGILGVIFVFFLVFFVFVLALKKLGWNLYQNVFSIFILCTQIFKINEADLGHFLGTIFRDLPLLALTLLFLIKIFQFFVLRQIPDNGFSKAPGLSLPRFRLRGSVQ